MEASYRDFRTMLETHYRTQPVEPTEGCLALFAWLRSDNPRNCCSLSLTV
ncbi:MAG: hypothetical protein ACKO21_00060 [Nodosilinea sp.]